MLTIRNPRSQIDPDPLETNKTIKPSPQQQDKNQNNIHTHPSNTPRNTRTTQAHLRTRAWQNEQS